MSGVNRCQRAAARLLELAPANVQPYQEVLLPLLERLLQQQHDGAEPLHISAEELITLGAGGRDALSELPLELVIQAEGGAQLWSKRRRQQEQRLMQELVQRLSQQRGLLLTGGAGTGKTTLVKELLQDERGRLIWLLAPTGKAAARLRESLAPLPESMRCATVHRALEADGAGGYRRGHQRPLEAEVVVVDEVSMLDSGLMQALLNALPPTTRLILVGDPAQLPPIGGSGVLNTLEQNLQQQQPQHHRRLERSHRFNDATALGRFVQRLRQGVGGAELQQLLQEQSGGNLSWWPLQHRWPRALVQRIDHHRLQLQQSCLDPSCDDTSALACLDELMVLSPRRRGRHGVEQLNSRWLGLDPSQPQRWPAGTPLLVGRNDAGLGLANGDRGVVRPGPRGAEAVIATADGPQRFPLALVPAPEPALAMTVHKSQGSQASEVIALMPQGETMDRRMLYTALTRARTRVDLISLALDHVALIA